LVTLSCISCGPVAVPVFVVDVPFTVFVTLIFDWYLASPHSQR
jgi:hypothetical protein